MLPCRPRGLLIHLECTTFALFALFYLYNVWHNAYLTHVHCASLLSMSEEDYWWTHLQSLYFLHLWQLLPFLSFSTLYPWHSTYLTTPELGVSKHTYISILHDACKLLNIIYYVSRGLLAVSSLSGYILTFCTFRLFAKMHLSSVLPCLRVKGNINSS